MSELNEFVTFTTTTQAGDTVEMAVLLEFEFEDKEYVAAGLVENDEIKEGVYLFKVKPGDDFMVERLRNNFEYEKVSKAYLEMLDEE